MKNNKKLLWKSVFPLVAAAAIGDGKFANYVKL